MTALGSRSLFAPSGFVTDWHATADEFARLFNAKACLFWHSSLPEGDDGGLIAAAGFSGDTRHIEERLSHDNPWRNDFHRVGACIVGEQDLEADGSTGAVYSLCMVIFKDKPPSEDVLVALAVWRKEPFSKLDWSAFAYQGQDVIQSISQYSTIFSFNNRYEKEITEYNTPVLPEYLMPDLKNENPELETRRARLIEDVRNADERTLTAIEQAMEQAKALAEGTPQTWQNRLARPAVSEQASVALSELAEIAANDPPLFAAKIAAAEKVQAVTPPAGRPPKLTHAQREDIRQRRVAGEQVNRLAESFGVDRATIFRITHEGSQKKAGTHL